MRITLTVTEGPGAGQRFTFDRHDFFIVGRSNKAHFRLPKADKFSSRIHFLVEVNPPHCRLLDMKSHNGTRVNGNKVEETDLKDGDQIQVGKTVLRLTVYTDAIADAATQNLPSTENSGPTPPPAARPAKPPVAIPVAVAVSRPTVSSCRICGAPTESAPPLPLYAPLCSACRQRVEQHPQPIKGYQIVQVLGQGGMGIVYQALSTDGSVVALKSFLPKVRPTPQQVGRFLREVRTLEKVKHPHIVAFREFGDSAGQLYCAMEFVQGTDACRIVMAHGPLPVARAVNLVCQLLEALEYAHNLGCVHRDIKPGNMLVTQVAGQETVKLADFGLAREYQASMMSGLTSEGELSGTIAFMPPEQITDFHGVGPPADQYSAAASLYNLLTRRYVYDLPAKDTAKQLGMVLQEAPVPILTRRSELSKDLAAVVHRGLAREPKDRFAGAGAMREALLPFVGG